MSKPFNELGERLLRSGVAPRHVRRYLSELADHLADLTAEEERAGRSRADAESAALIRLGGMDDLARAMIEQRQFQSWSVRAPWAAFGAAPLLFLAAAWCVALFLPVVRLEYLSTRERYAFRLRPNKWFDAIVYFGIGKSIFFGAPILIGWGIGVVTIRQRLKPVWPAVGLALIALIGGTLKVGVTRARRDPDALDISTWASPTGPPVRSFRMACFMPLVILSLAVLPYLIWRLQRVHTLHQPTR